MDVIPELSRIGALYAKEEYDAGLEQLWQLWESVPEPKSETPNAYMAIEYGVAFSFKKGDLDEAEKWADLAPQFAEVRHDMGEVEYLQGRVAFERGDFESAKEKFVVANEKSEGRIFEDQNKKYRELL